MRDRIQALKILIHRLGPAGVVGLLSGTLPPWGGFLVLGIIPLIRPWLMDHPVGGPLVAILMGMILGGCMIMPTYIFAVLCGSCFGALQGTLVAVTGILLGGILNYLWARALCGDRVINLIDEKPKLAILRQELLQASPKRTFLLLTLMRVPPGFPFALTNFMVAAMKIPLGMMALSLAIGCLPRTAIVATAAGQVGGGLGLLGWSLIIGSTLLLLVIVGKVASNTLTRLTQRVPTHTAL